MKHYWTICQHFSIDGEGNTAIVVSSCFCRHSLKPVFWVEMVRYYFKPNPVCRIGRFDKTFILQKWIHWCSTNCLELSWIVSHVVLIFLQISELLLVFIKSTDVCCLEIEPGKYPQNTYIFLIKQSPQLAASLKRMKRHNSLLPVHNSQKIITKLPWKNKI